MKGPYLLLWYLFVMDGVYKRFALPRQGRLMTSWLGLKAFATYPNIGLGRRLKNMLLVAALAILPRPLRMAIERGMIDYEAT